MGAMEDNQDRSQRVVEGLLAITENPTAFADHTGVLQHQLVDDLGSGLSNNRDIILIFCVVALGRRRSLSSRHRGRGLRERSWRAVGAEGTVAFLRRTLADITHRRRCPRFRGRMKDGARARISNPRRPRAGRAAFRTVRIRALMNCQEIAEL
jgi:hypothetical protein